MKTIRKIGALALAVVLMAIVTPGFAQNAPTSNAAVFQDLGGLDGIKQIVGDFLPIVLNDARIKNQFKDVDMEHLAKMLTEQFCELSGGPCKYTGKDMKTIHADLGVTNVQFNALAEDLQLAMDKHGVSSRSQNKLIAKLAPMQHSIVTK